MRAEYKPYFQPYKKMCTYNSVNNIISFTEKPIFYFKTILILKQEEKSMAKNKLIKQNFLTKSVLLITIVVSL